MRYSVIAHSVVLDLIMTASLDSDIMTMTIDNSHYDDPLEG